MTIQHIYSRVRKIFPAVTFPEIVALINDAYDDGDQFLTGYNRKKINVVKGKLLYTPGDEVISIERVFYLSKDNKYKPIPRLIGNIDIGDLDS